ncbi:MAG TPA: TPM domain-containing protein, partial [Symbiobacteriaceae bacterium]|nr:TPM domain-containing protein [Symbiobacteriaceae bacterium]
MARVLALVTALLLLWGAPAAAVPGSIVVDQSGTLTTQQAATLNAELAHLQYPFHVYLVGTAFPSGKPANAEAEFQNFAHKLLNASVPKEAVLITVSMQDRLVDFRVYADGPVNQRFLAKTGRAFADHTPAILEAYRAPARAGDIPGGILAAARAIDALVPVTAEVAPAPVVTPAPEVTPAPVVPVSPDRLTVYEAPQPVPQPERGNPWPALGGIAVVFAAGAWTVYFWRYRKARLAALNIRDRFLGDLLQLMERELPLAAKYAGEETQAAWQATSGAVDAALHVEQAGEELRTRAER